MKSQDIRHGMAVLENGEVYLVTHFEHVKPGKGPAYAQVKLKNLRTTSHIEKRFRSGEDVEQIDLDRRQLEYLYSDASGAVFMDDQSYEQPTVPDHVLGDALQFIKPNQTITALLYNGNILSIELPASVDLQVTDTPPGIKHATATSQLKEATLETGLKTKIPPFINSGEVVRVSTETGEYLNRVTGA